MKLSRVIGNVLFYLLVLVIIVFAVFPFYYAIITSFKSGTALFQIDYWPRSFSLANYEAVLTKGNFPRNLLNSVIVSFAVVFISLLLAVTAAFALSRVRFRGRSALLLLILSVSMFPSIAVLAGLFELIRAMGIYNSLPALIFSYMIFTLPFTVWVLTTFMRELPIEIEEAAIVDYLRAYQQRAHPAPATYYRRFLLVRRFLRWVCRRHGAPDPFLDLEPPPKPRQERDWLTREEFRRLLDAACRPERNLPGLAARDRLALLALVTTGLRRSELCALEWRDLELEGRRRSLLVRCGKGGKPRRQPLPANLARELRELRDARQPAPTDPVLCGLAGGRLQETILADIIRRAARRAGLEKHVTAHTLRHTAATWLRQERGDTRLVAEYLGHADLSTVSRYAHVDREELFAAAGRLEQLATPRARSEAPADASSAHDARREQSASSTSSEDTSGESERPRRRRRRRRRRGHR